MRRSLLAFSLLLALAAPAQASQVVAGGSPPFGPHLAGPEVVWGEYAPDGGVDVRAAAPGGAPRLLHHIPRGGTIDTFQLFASDTHFGWRDQVSHPCGKGGECPTFTEIWAGPLNGPYERVARCDNSTLPFGPQLSGNTLVYIGAGCSAPDNGAVAIRELRDGEDALRAIPISAGYVSDLSVDGRFAGYTFNGSAGPVTHVFDAAAGSDAYTLPFGARGDVQADGKITFVRAKRTRPDDGPQWLGFATPAEPRDHELPVVQAGLGRITYPLEMAGDRIVFARPRDTCKLADPTLDLVVTDLAGNQALLGELRGYAVIGSRPNAFDFDGRRVTWAGVGPSGPAILLQDVAAEPPPATANGPECPVARGSDIGIRGGRIKVDRRGRAPLRLSCRAALDSQAVTCRGRLEIRPVGGGGLLGSARFRIAPERSGVVKVKLRRRALQRLRARRTLRVDVLAAARAPANNGFTSLRLLAPRR